MAKKKKKKGSARQSPERAVTRSERPSGERESAKTENRERHRRVSATIKLPPDWQIDAATFGLLVLATVALYAGALRAGFLGIDDPQYVVDNLWIRSFSPDNLAHILTTPYFANYSPLHLLSYSLDYAFAGASPFAFHLSSSIWAGVVAGFVFLAALQLTLRRSIAIAAAVLFVFHPAHVEAVAWIASRKDLVAAAFALPALIAYLRYRKQGRFARRWYIASLVLFALALAGKMSVATFPAVFLACDMFLEKRPVARAWLDKIPYVALAAVFALVVALAQPPSGHHPNTYVIAAAFAQSLWLLTGFGTYVIYRVPPNPNAGLMLQLLGALLLLVMFVAPWFLRRRWPAGAVLLYWILFALIPAQVLSFLHPVTDRYLFLPSAGVVIFIAWGVFTLSERFGRRVLIGAAVVLTLITVLWARTTLVYLADWRDPRSVWYSATAKSADPEAYYNLGSYYQDVDGRLGTQPRGEPLPEADARRLATAVWADDQRLPALLQEWTNGLHGPVEAAFRSHLRSLAWDAFEERLRTKDTTLMPNLYFRRGLILSDNGDLNGARREFAAAADEASRFPLLDQRQEFAVRSHNALGIIAWREGQYQEAMRWLKMAEDEQLRAGGNWVPDLTANRQRLERIISPAAK